MVSTLRLIGRRVLRHRAHTALATISLAFGFGAFVLAVTVANSVEDVVLPMVDRTGLYWIGQQRGPDQTATSLVAIDAWRTGSRTLTGISGYTTRSMRLEEGDRTESIRVALVSWDLFKTLGVRPAHGRAFLEEDERVGSAATVVISDQLWRERFGGRRDVLGEQVRFNGTLYIVVGVMRPEIAFPGDGTLAWVPITHGLGALATVPGIPLVSGIGRARPGVPTSAVQRDLARIAAAEAELTGGVVGDGPAVEPLREHLLRDVLPRTRILLMLAIVILTLSCAHVANMLVAQVLRRRAEWAVRRVLGATLFSLFATLVAEVSVVLAGGAVAGVGFAWGTIVLASKYAGQSGNIPELLGPPVSGPAIVLTLGTVAVLALGLGVIGLGQVPRYEFSGRLRATVGSGAWGIRTRTRDTLTLAGVALTVVVLLSAGALARTYLDLARRALGFDVADVYVARVARPYVVFTSADHEAVRGFMQRVVESLARARGIDAAGVSNEPPGGGSGMISQLVNRALNDSVTAGIQAVTPRYFSALGLRVLRGREFGRQDDDTESDAIVVDETIATTLFGDGNAVERTVSLPDLGLQGRIVGVVARTRQSGATTEGLPQVYLPYSRLPLPWATVVLRSKLPPTAVRAALQSAVSAEDPKQPVESFERLADRMANQLDRSRFYTVLLIGFAVASSVLTGIGLYGVVALIVAERRREVGIRMCLGATPFRVVSWILYGAGKPVAAGLLTGILVGWWSTRALSALLYGVQPFGVVNITMACLAIAAIATIATLVPAFRAVATPPSSALRAS